ncbi:9069_t:CDS:2, partial [Dentiscutata heterogama]
VNTNDEIKASSRVRESGEGIYGHDFYLETYRDDYKKEIYINYAFSPIRKLDGTVWV